MLSGLLALLTACLVPSCATMRIQSLAWPGPADWPWQTLVQCGAAAGNWAQAGEVWVADDEGTHNLERTHTSLCSEPGFTEHQHGDYRNEVKTNKNGRFLYVAGNEPGTGAGVTLCDVGNRPAELEYVFTSGLMGCMALSITGTHKQSGTRDVFFAHARHWSGYTDNVVVPENDPMHAAQDFVRSHNDLNVFYGSGDHGGPRITDVSVEARMLSQILGVWVTNDYYHSKPFQRTLAFHIQLEAWVPLSGQEESVRVFTEEQKKAGFASLYATPSWEPNRELIEELSMMEFAEGSDKLRNGVTALRAYAAGNFDEVGSMVRSMDYALRTQSQEQAMYGRRLGGWLRKCLQDMVEKGYEKRQASAKQPEYQKISAPRTPN